MAKRPRQAKAAPSVTLDFAFYRHLHFFYQDNKKAIRRSYKELTKKFLDFNDPEKAGSFLREPQFEALEMYVFLKEAADNAYVHQLFDAWFKKEGIFQGRANATETTFNMFESLTEQQYRAAISRLKSGQRMYPNYIFALTMGTGKTILMATCIFYEFILANKWPADKRYCHNALVFAPDRTVLQSLKEIQSFDFSKVVPPEYVNFLNTHLQFHFLEDAGTSLSVLDKSKFNIVVSNTQKIILKKQHKEKTAVDLLFSSGAETHKKVATAYDQIADLYIDESPANEAELSTNQRFEKLKRLGQLGIYVDEAHHAFGDALAKDMGIKSSPTSLRVTIDELAAALNNAGTRVVACFNYTGTPYVGREVLPEVVYAYGLKEAISKGYLKKTQVDGYTNVKANAFVQDVIDDFVSHFKRKRFEGMLPKLAFFAATIEELQKELKPAVEKALAKHDISLDRVLVNVGDDKLTTNDDIREFNKLDTPESKKQFILLVNKGREGWNCRSLFGVALYREPKSRIFVLQATMRCLRAIGDGQQTGHIYLGEENLETLNQELEQNFRISTQELMDAGKEKLNVEVRPLPPPIKIKLKRVHKSYQLKEKKLADGVDLGLDKLDLEKYRSFKVRHSDHLEGNSGNPGATVSLASEQYEFTELTIAAEIAKYLNKSPILIDEILRTTKDGIEKILKRVNEYNEILYDEVIPKLFLEMYDLIPNETSEEHEVELIKSPPSDTGFYSVSADKDLVVRASDAEAKQHKDKSFHLDTYCFDSKPEHILFWDLLRESRVKNVWFTGMLTHGQSDFFIQYIDPDTHSVRSYYPDFVFVDEKGVYNIVEVKGDNMIDDPTVQAKKEFAQQMAVASGMTYQIIKGSDVTKRGYRQLLE